MELQRLGLCLIQLIINSNFIRSTDNGSNWETKSTANLSDLAFGNSTFISCGASGTIYLSIDNGSGWSTSNSGTTNSLNDITFGGNQFFSVGNGGTIVKSTDNGSSWNSVTVPAEHSTTTFKEIIYGNNKFDK